MKWEIVKLGEIAEIYSGFAFKSSDMSSESGIPLIKIKNICDKKVSAACDTFINPEVVSNPKYDRFILQEDDFLIAMTGQGSVGRIGKMHHISEKYYVNQRVAIVRTNKQKAFPNFVFLQVATDNNEIHFFNKANGAGQPNLSAAQIGDLIIIIPDYRTQERIAELLQDYNDLIENNQKQIKLLEEAAQRLYKEWFVDLRFPGYETTTIVDGLPEGWERKRLIDIADVQYGFAFDGTLFNSEGHGTPIIRIRNIPDGTTGDYTTETADEQYIVKNGEIVVGMDGEFHINSWCGDDSYLVQRTCCIKPHDPAMNGWLLWAIYAPIKFFEKTIVGATVAHLGKKHIDTIELLTAPEKLYTPFDTIFKKRQLLLNQTRKLSEARDRLLPKLMSGEIEV